ncbi:MAG: ABC transporter permease subunit [Planctomycetota bacterium]
MRQPGPSDRALQWAVAALLILPLFAAFLGGGGFSDAYGTYQPGDQAAAARRLALAAATGRSLLVGALATLLAVALGVPGGWALAQRSGTPSRCGVNGPAGRRRSQFAALTSALFPRGRGKLLALVLATLPLALPPSVAVSGWVGLLAPAGAASRFNVPIPGFGAESRGWLFSSLGAALVLGLGLWPIVALELWPAFRRVLSSSAYDAARLHAAESRTFWRIVLPQAKGELAAGAVLAFLLASSDFSVSSLLLVRTLPIEIHDALTVGKTAAAAWAALPLLVLVFAAAIVLHSRLAPSPYPLPQGEGEKNSTARAPVARSLLSAGILLGFVLPLAVCGWQAWAGGKPMSLVFSAGSSALVVSLRIAGAAAALAVVLVLLRTVCWPEMRVRAINGAALFLLAVPGSFLAAACLASQVELQKAARAVDAGQLAAALPLAILALSYAARFLYAPLRLVEEGLAALNPGMFEAAALAGHGRLSRAVAVAVPLVATHIAAGAALVFVLVLGDIAIADKLHPPGYAPATVWLFQMQHLGYDEAVFGLSLLLGAVAAAALLAAGLAVGWLSKAKHFGF